MKTLQEIQERVSLERFGCELSEALRQMDFLDIVEFTNDTANAYAQSACEDLRERIAEEARMTYHCGHTKRDYPTVSHQSGADNIQIDKDSIRNVEIILP